MSSRLESAAEVVRLLHRINVLTRRSLPDLMTVICKADIAEPVRKSEPASYKPKPGA